MAAPGRSTVKINVLLAGLLALPGMATAQDVPPPPSTAPPPASAPPPVSPSTLAQAPSPSQRATGTDVTTLGEVRAIKPDEGEPVDLYRFRNPVQIQPNRFSRSWSEPPSPEQVGQGGGYIMMGIYYGLAQAAKGLHKLTNGPDQIQSAVARPPPGLAEDQQRRALMLCAQQDGCGAAEGGPRETAAGPSGGTR